MSVIKSNGAGDQSTGFYNGVATQSLRIDDGANASLTYTPSAGNRKLWTFSTWVKKTKNSGSSGDQFIFSQYTGTNNNDTALALLFRGDDLDVTGNSIEWLRSDAKFRDTSAWYHILWVLDTANGTDALKMRLYVNATEITSFSSDNRDHSSLDDANMPILANVEHMIGKYPGDNNRNLDGYLAYTELVDGTALTPSSFTETKNGVLIPKKYTGSHGNQGFRLEYKETGDGSSTASTSTIGADTSGNNKHFVDTNLDAYDSNMPDSPENNFSTWNALWTGGEQSASIYAAPTLSNGNLQVSLGQNAYVGNNFRPTSGKWYCEIRIKSMGTTNGEIDYGWLQATTYAGTTGHAGQANKWGAIFYGYSSLNSGVPYIAIYDETSQLGGNINVTFQAGDILQLALDIDNNKGFVGRNNAWAYSGNLTGGDPANGTNPTFTFTADEAQNLQWYIANGTSTDVHVANFGQDSTFGGDETATSNADANGIGAFHHAPPTNFLALCTSNLEETTISPNADTQATDHFNTVLYTSDNIGANGTQNVTGVGFKPDWVWLKNRDSTDTEHTLYDSSRGTGRHLSSSTTAAEVGLNSQYGYLGTFGQADDTADGFVLRGGSSNSNYVAQSTDKYVSWNWKANGSTTSTNDDGSIQSTLQANTTAGFSIVLYTGSESDATVGHGLGGVPDMLIWKKRNGANDWIVYHSANTSAPATDHLHLNNKNGTSDVATMFQDTLPTSTVFSIGTDDDVNDAKNYVVYCFRSIEGYSKFGSYTTNAANTGPFVYTGFKPAWVMVKVTGGSSNASYWSWTIYDNKRVPFNTNHSPLFANSSVSENYRGDESTTTGGNTLYFDFLSNGFKVMNGGTEANGTAGTVVVFMAFAEAPFKYANAK